MLARRIPALCALSLLVTSHVALAQGLPRVIRFAISSYDSLYTLPDPFIVPGTLRLALDDTLELRDSVDYLFDARSRRVLLSLSFRVRAFAETIRSRLISIMYRYRPIPMPERLALRRLENRSDTTTERAVAGGSTSSSQEDEGLFGSSVKRSASIIRGVTIGSDRDLTLQSGLRMQFSGKIAQDVEVLAALTDEQSPLQPEGTTQTLREIDNIFFEVRSPWVGGTMGKFVARGSAGLFTSFERKLQGVSIHAHLGPDGGTAQGVYAISPGTFKSQSFVGIEGNQGPYRLSGLSNERDIVVVGGSERVFIDGNRLTRGEHEDYVIDYTTAQVTFNPRRVITSASRITVDFEYADQKYSRSFLALSHSAPFAQGAVEISASYLREGDDPDATVGITLTDADRSLLEAVGSDGSRAVRSGVSLVGRTDSLIGSYVRIDTILNGLPDSIYVYDPASPLAVYNVTFSIPPSGTGDYRSIAFGQYEFVGKGRGSYLPVVYLPLPRLLQVGALSLSAHSSRAGVRADIAFSGSSLNRLSDAPEASRSGLAFSVEGSARSDSLYWLGEIRITTHLRYLTSQFRAIDRISEVDFDNHWNAVGRPGETGKRDAVVEGELEWRPARRLELTFSGGMLERGSAFRSRRGQAVLRLEPRAALPGGEYAIDVIDVDSTAGFRNDIWLRQRGGVTWPVGGFTPGLRFAWERRLDRVSASDTIAPTSFRYLEAGPELKVAAGAVLATASFRYRLDDSVRGAGSGRTFVRDGTSRTVQVRGELVGVSGLASSLDLTWRLRSYDPVQGIDPSSRLDNSSLALRSRTRWSLFDRGLDLDASYTGQSERAARLQRLYIRVPFGQGEYVWIDRDSNGVQNVEEFKLTNAGDGEYVPVILPTEDLFPVTDLAASLRIRAQPGRFIDRFSTLGLFLGPLTTETILRVDEKSQSTDDAAIYLLDLSRFQDDSTTINGGSVVQQDIILYESNPDFSTRFRIQDRRGLTRLVTALERSRTLERSVRMRWRPTFDVGLQFDLGLNRGLLRSTDSLSRRSYDLSSTTGTGDLGYRPASEWEFGWTLTVAQNDDVAQLPARSTTRNTNVVRGIYSIENHGRFRVDIERTSVAGVNIGNDVFSLPFQLTDGYAIGTTWVARASLEYRFGANIQASVLYTGRVQPQSKTLFSIGTAEVRAYF